MSESARDRDVPELDLIPSGLNDRIRQHQPSVPRILMLNYGFFLYPVKEGWCANVFAPFVPGVSHSAVLVIPQEAVVGTVPADLERHPHLPVFMVRLAEGATVEFEGADARSRLVRRTTADPDEPDFDFVPDFVTWCKGVRLDPGTLKSPTKVAARVRMGGGWLAACPDFFSGLAKWSWGDVTHRVTALTAHLTDPGPREIVISRGGSTVRVALQKEGLVPLLLLNVPIDEASSHEVGFAHIQSMLQFCSPTGPVEILKTERAKCPSSVAGVRIELGGLSAMQEYLNQTDEPRRNGEPQCSGQQIPDPS